MNLILLGLPGAGKGTQAKMISKEYKLPHISTGDIFRSQIKEGTPLGTKVKKIIDSGQLVPDEDTIAMVRERFEEDDVKDGFILDGFPRTVNQAKALNELLDDLEMDLDYVLYIKAEESELVERLSGRRICSNCGATYHLIYNPPEKEGVCDRCGSPLTQRSDDREEAVKTRLKENRERIEQLVSFYKDKGVLKPIPSDSIDTVFTRIKEAIEVSG